jgi:hypothetical protein
MKHAMARPKSYRPSAKARIFSVLLSGLALCLPAQHSSAQDLQHSYPVVVELFTSQGCSSCPPADALLAELAKRDDVLALALHVDYWDYIGWKDIFADPKFTLRQRGYARAAGHRTIYTPQMIVSGKDHLVGFNPMKLADLVTKHKNNFTTAPRSLSASRDGDTLAISLTPGDLVSQNIRVQVVQYRPLQKVAIRVGENAGKAIDYANIVTSWTHIENWDGQAPMTLTANLTSMDPTAVILQQDLDGLPGEILAALRVK